MSDLSFPPPFLSFPFLSLPSLPFLFFLLKNNPPKKPPKKTKKKKQHTPIIYHLSWAEHGLFPAVGWEKVISSVPSALFPASISISMAGAPQYVVVLNHDTTLHLPSIATLSHFRLYLLATFAFSSFNGESFLSL